MEELIKDLKNKISLTEERIVECDNPEEINFLNSCIFNYEGQLAEFEKEKLIEALSIDTGLSKEIIEREISILQNSNTDTERGDPLNLLKGLGLELPKEKFTNRFLRKLSKRKK